MVGFGRRARSRSARQLGAVLGLLAVVTAALPIGSANAAVQPAVGANGTVLGFSGWYGSYSVAGVGTGFCLDFGKAAPDSAYGYRLASPVGGTLGGQLAYVARTYGGTRDAVTAAAAKLVVHDLQNARYPYGELNVMTLHPGQVAGFGGRGGEVISRARAIMSDTVARYLVGPYRLTLTSPTAVGEDRRIPVGVTLLDGRGRAVTGTQVTLTATNTTTGSVAVTTDSRGKASATFTATSGEVSVRITASATLPNPAPVVYAPSHPDHASRAQRLLRSGDTKTEISIVRTVAEQPDTTVTVTVRKTGDATAYHPVDGATFELRAGTPDGPRVAGPVIVANGQAAFGPVVTNDIGDLWLVEVEAPDGYALADPVAVPVEGTTTVDVKDEALRGSLRLVKLDAQTEQPVAGAVLRVRYDADNDGTYETTVGTVRTEVEPVEVADLLPGRYEVVEAAAPPGYELPADARSEVVLEPDGTLTVTFSDSSLTTVGFRKQPTGAFDPKNYSLAGAVFVVTDEAGREAGRCTTDKSGGCTLPESTLVTGRRYCWAETVAPPGFAKAQGNCFTATGRQDLTVVEVAEQGRYTTIEVVKHDADDPDRPLPGATYALLPAGGGEPLATATTGADGVGRFPPVLPGSRYCVREVTAPAGYQLDHATHCTDGPVGEATTIRLRLTDKVIPAPPVARPRPELPRTGTTSVRLAQLGLASLLGGASLVLFGAPPRPRYALWPAGHLD